MGLGLVSWLRRQPAKSGPFFTGPNSREIARESIGQFLRELTHITIRYV
jgi:hypothetical protein